MEASKTITKQRRNHKTGVTWSLSAGDWPVQENQPMVETGRRRVSGVFRKLPVCSLSNHARRSNALTRNRVSLPGTHGTEDAQMLIYYKTEQIQIRRSRVSLSLQSLFGVILACKKSRTITNFCMTYISCICERVNNLHKMQNFANKLYIFMINSMGRIQICNNI